MWTSAVFVILVAAAIVGINVTVIAEIRILVTFWLYLAKKSSSLLFKSDAVFNQPLL
jgi:hypothetical protein